MQDRSQTPPPNAHERAPKRPDDDSADKAADAFRQHEFVLALIGVGLTWFLLLACLIVFALLSSDRPAFVFALTILNLFGTACLWTVRLQFKPSYQKAWKGPKPLALSQGLLDVLVTGGALYLVFRSEADEARVLWAVGMFYVWLLLLGGIAGMAKLEKVNRLGVTGTAYIATALALVMLHLGLGWLFRADLGQFALSLVAATVFSMGWIMLIGMLLSITVSPAKTENIPHAHVAIVRFKERHRVVTGNTVDIGKGESVTMEDLRMRVMTIEHECETTDHCSVRVYATMNWRIGDTKLRGPAPTDSTQQDELLAKQTRDDLEKYLTFAQAPEDFLRHELRSALSRAIGQMQSEVLAGNVAYIERLALRHVYGFRFTLGVTIHSVSITKFQTIFPPPPPPPPPSGK